MHTFNVAYVTDKPRKITVKLPEYNKKKALAVAHDKIVARGKGEPDKLTVVKTEIDHDTVKPSEWLQAALEDLEATERDPDYYIDMGIWHEPVAIIGPPNTAGRKLRSAPKCVVCMAGAVMAKRFDIPVDVSFMPNASNSTAKERGVNIPASIENRIEAINSIRTGDLRGYLTYARWPSEGGGGPDALWETVGWKVYHSNSELFANVPPYHEDRRGFKKAMRAIIKVLAKAGI